MWGQNTGYGLPMFGITEQGGTHRGLTSKLLGLIELVMGKPLVSAGMVANTLGVTPQAARRIVGELGLREMTGRFRAWGCFE